jgi:nucleoside-diphosphate-sugar epimerase
MRAFVTGASGSLGWPLVNGLLARGYEVRALLRTGGRAREGIAQVMQSRGIDVVTADLGEHDRLQAALAGCDALFHLAWQANPGSDPDFADGTPETCIERNLDGVRAVIDAARAAGVRRLVFPSTTSVYGTASFGGGQSLDEAAPTVDAEPIAQRHWHNYAAGKVLAERLILAASDLEPVILRPSPVYGPDQRGTLMTIWRMLGAGAAAAPGQTLQWIHRDDLIDALVCAAQAAAQPEPIFNIAGRQAVLSNELKDVVQTIADCLYKAKPLPDIDAALRPLPHTFDIGKAHYVLKFVPAVPLSRGLVEVVARALYGDLAAAPLEAVRSSKRWGRARAAAAQPAAATAAAGATAPPAGLAPFVRPASLGPLDPTADAAEEVSPADWSMAGKVCLVTGATSGIRRLAEDVEKRQPRLDVLINNAGSVFGQRQLSADGLEMTFALNHLGYFLLTGLMMPLLERAEGARIVNVSSEAHRGVVLDFSDLQHQRQYHGFFVYRRTKLANVLFTYELARLLDGSGTTVNAVTPGHVLTNIGFANGWMSEEQWLSFSTEAVTPEEAAVRCLHVAASPDVEGISGAYFNNCQAVTSSPASYDLAAAAELWAASEALCGFAAPLRRAWP